jgi:hypothetical protein
MVITDIPAVMPSLGACAAWVVAKAVHPPHKEGHSQASKYIKAVHISSQPYSYDVSWQEGIHLCNHEHEQQCLCGLQKAAAVQVGGYQGLQFILGSGGE